MATIFISLFCAIRFQFYRGNQFFFVFEIIQQLLPLNISVFINLKRYYFSFNSNSISTNIFQKKKHHLFIYFIFLLVHFNVKCFRFKTIKGKIIF